MRRAIIVVGLIVAGAGLAGAEEQASSARGLLESGQYQQVGPRGGHGREVTVVKTESLPPTTTKGATYKLVDGTRNKSGQ